MQGGRDEFTSMGFVAPSALSGRANGRGGREWLASQVCRGRIAWTRRCTRPSRSLPKWRLQGETHPEAPGHWQEMMRRSSAASSAPVSFRTADSEPAVDVGGGGDDRGRGAGGRQRRGWAWRWWPAREGDEGDGGRAESTVTARAWVRDDWALACDAWFHRLSYFFSVSASLVLLTGGMRALGQFFALALTKDRYAYWAEMRSVRRPLAKTILLSLDFLLAADVVDTLGDVKAATAPDLFKLAALVLLRAFMSFHLTEECKSRGGMGPEGAEM